jgi:hypothetical protein
VISKSLHKIILEQDRRLLLIEQIGRNMFYFPPTEHILSGIFIHNGPSEAYIGRIIIPLCDELTIISQGFGGRFSGHQGEIRKPKTTKEFLSELTSTINSNIDFLEHVKIICKFINIFHDAPIARSIPYSRMIANCLIVNGDYNNARVYLGAAINELNRVDKLFGWQIDYLNTTEMILHTLDRSPQNARNLLLEWEEENKSKFHIL